MRRWIASGLRGIADWLDGEHEPNRGGTDHMFLRSPELSELQSGPSALVAGLDCRPADGFAFEEDELPAARVAGGGMYL